MKRPSADPRPASPGLRVLLVEDCPERAAHLGQLLAGAPAGAFELTTAADTAGALARLSRGGFDAVLVDATRLGQACLEALLAGGPTGPAVLSLGEQEDDSRALRSLRAGAQDYLALGGLDAAGLARALRHAVERHRVLRERTRLRARESFSAHHDALTGLPNRSALQERLRSALDGAAQHGRRLAVLFLDIDDFKSLNDTLGQPAGDAALRIVAERLSAAGREQLLVARLGGDEFAVVVEPADDPYALASITQSIQAEMARPLHLAGRECWLTVSIGVAVFPHDGRDPEPLLRNADTAMAHAKSQGPNQFHYYEDGMEQRTADRFQLVNNLHEAISRGELVLHYQPQVDVGLRAIVGAEALIRWRHPSRGLISPGDFISVAEETGMIMPIGEWVLRAACRDAVRWNLDEQASFRVSVNVSARQLGQHGFSQEVACILAETGLSAARLEIEITETGVMNADETTLASLANLRRLGVTLAMDDFGTGYSSLTLLKELAVDRLKIDQSFVRGTGSPGADEVIVGGLIRMAEGLGIETVAEGVETREQLRSLYAEGCHQMQGYLFGKPVPAGDLAALLAAPELPWEAELDAAGI